MHRARISEDSEQEFHYLVDIVQQLGEAEEQRAFTGVCASLNQLSDRYLWPRGGDPVSRLIREVTREVTHRSER